MHSRSATWLPSVRMQAEPGESRYKMRLRRLHPAESSEAGSFRSPTTNSAPAWRMASSRSQLAVLRTRARTLSPWLASRRTTSLPSNPLAPTTRTIGVLLNKTIPYRVELSMPEIIRGGSARSLQSSPQALQTITARDQRLSRTVTTYRMVSHNRKQ